MSKIIIVVRLPHLDVFLFWKNLIPHFTSADQNPATGDILHRLPDQRSEERRPEQWGGRLQGGHSQEVEREDGGAETKRTGKQ